MKQQHARHYRSTGGRSARRAAVGWITVVIVVLVASSAIVMGRISAVSKERSQLAAAAARGPRVLVERAQAEQPHRTISVPATISGYSETSIFAKIPGY